MKRREFIAGLGGDGVAVGGAGAAVGCAGYRISHRGTARCRGVSQTRRGVSPVDYWKPVNTRGLGTLPLTNIATRTFRLERPAGACRGDGSPTRRGNRCGALSPNASPPWRRRQELIPIVFMVGIDPVEAGLVASLGRPGGQSSRVYPCYSPRWWPSGWSCCTELVPAATSFGHLVDPTTPAIADAERRDLQIAAGALGVRLQDRQCKRGKRV